MDEVRRLLITPEIVVRTWKVLRTEGHPVSEREVREALETLDPLWEALFPAEQARIVRLLVERVDIHLDGARIRLRTDGLASLMQELRARNPDERAAA